MTRTGGRGQKLMLTRLQSDPAAHRDVNIEQPLWPARERKRGTAGGRGRARSVPTRCAEERVGMRGMLYKNIGPRIRAIEG